MGAGSAYFSDPGTRPAAPQRASLLQTRTFFLLFFSRISVGLAVERGLGEAQEGLGGGSNACCGVCVCVCDDSTSRGSS